MADDKASIARKPHGLFKFVFWPRYSSNLLHLTSNGRNFSYT